MVYRDLTKPLSDTFGAEVISVTKEKDGHSFTLRGDTGTSLNLFPYMKGAEIIDRLQLGPMCMGKKFKITITEE